MKTLNMAEGFSRRRSAMLAAGQSLGVLLVAGGAAALLYAFFRHQGAFEGKGAGEALAMGGLLILGLGFGLTSLLSIAIVGYVVCFPIASRLMGRPSPASYWLGCWLGTLIGLPLSLLVLPDVMGTMGTTHTPAMAITCLAMLSILPCFLMSYLTFSRDDERRDVDLRRTEGAVAAQSIIVVLTIILGAFVMWV